MLNYFLRPARRNELQRDFFDEFFNTDYVKGMKTDITETETEYLMDIELPGYKKENVEITVNDGYLTVTAKKDESKETKNENYVSRERYTGSLSRSWYIGDVDKEQIKASFTNGILNINVPKTPAVKEKKYISID